MKNTKKALLLSVMSLVLCVTMLVGTTFAWFTDSVTSANNIIASGNLDVELYWSTDCATWTAVTEQTNVFTENALWEPGYTDVVYLKVVNEGSLYLKYQMGVWVVSETGSVNKAGEEFKLSDHILYGVGDTDVKFNDRADARAAVTTYTKLNEQFASDVITLAPGAEETVVLVAYMPETVGNEANHKTGEAQPTVKLALEVSATQVEAELDSFDKNYDAGAYLTTVMNAEQLAAALADGKSVRLGEDIVANEQILIPAGAKVTLDLNGKNLSGAVAKTDGHVLRNEGELTITGGTIESTADNGGSAVYNAAGAKLTLDGVTLYGAPRTGSSWPSYAINCSGDMTLKNVEITSNHGAISASDGAQVVIEDTDVTMNGIGGSSHVFYIGGNGTKVTVNGGNYIHKGNVDGSLAYIMAGSEMIINDGYFTASNGGYGLAAYNGSLVVNGGTFDNAFENWGGPIAVYGGSFKKNPTSYVPAGYAATQNADGTWTVGREYVTVTAPGTDKAANGAALADAINATTEASFIALGEGEYKMPSVSGSKDVTIVGDENTVVDVTAGVYMDSSKVAFEGVTIKTDTGMSGSDYAAFYAPNVTYTNCTFVGPMRLGRDGAKFVGCTFTALGDNYIWTMGNDCTFENCTFNSDGKALLVYADGGNEIANVVVKNCTFNATKGAKAGAIANQNCAAIEIDNTGAGVNLITEGNTCDSDFSGEWRIKSYTNAANTVTANGVVYTTIAIDGHTMTIDAERNVTVN